MLFEWNIHSFRTEILVEYPVMSTSQGTYVQIEQTPEVMRETYKVAESGGGLELRITGSTIALPFKTRCHREGCEVGSYLPSTASQKLAGSTEIWTQIAGFRVQSANHYTMEPSSSKWECPSVFSVEMTQKEALRKAADPLASVWCPKSTTGSPLPKARIKAGTFRSSV